MIVPLLLAAALASPCADLTVADPRLKIVRLRGGYDNEIVSVTVRNRGAEAQRVGIAQHLELVRAGEVIGSQPLPALGPQRNYVVAFRLQVPHQRKRSPLLLTFRYVLDRSESAARNNCDTTNDLLTATL